MHRAIATGATGADVVVKADAALERSRPDAPKPAPYYVYVTNEQGSSITVLDAKKHRVKKTITLAGENVKPMGTAMSPDGARLYVTTGRGGTLVAIDTEGDTLVASLAVGKRPWGVAVSADGARIYTANGPSNDVSVIDAATFKIVRRIPAGSMPWGVAISK